MKKFSALMLMCLFLVSLVPAVFAQDVTTDTRITVSTDTSVTDSSDKDDTADDSDSATTDDSAEDDLTRRQRLRQATVANVKEAHPDATRADVRKRLAQNPAAKRVAVARTAADIRANQVDRLEAARKKCAESEDPSRCEEALKARLDRLENLSEDALERVDRVKDRLADRYEDYKEDREKESFRKFKGAALKAREVAKDRVEQARERYNAARERHDAAKDKYQEARERFNANKDNVEECKDDESEDCENVRAQAKEDAIAQLSRALESAMAQLEKIKQRAEESDALTEEELADMLARIDAKIAEAKALQEKVDALTPESSYDEIKALTKEVRALLSGLHDSAQKHAVRAINARIGQAIAKSQKLSTRLDNALVKLAEKGKDTATAERLADEFNALVDEAAEHYEAAQRLWKSDDVQGAQEEMRAAHQNLKDAHAKLKEVVRAIHALGGERDLADSLADDASVDAEAEAAVDADASTDNVEDAE